MNEPRHGPDRARRRAMLAAGTSLALVFLAATLGPVLLGLDHFPDKSIDMDRNHVPVVRAFAETWPTPDLSDYDSATTPGMHWVLAGVTRLLGDSETVLQATTCVFGTGLVLVAWWFATIACGPWRGLACVLPLAASPYVIGNSIWVMTDNLALGLAAVSMGVAVFLRPRVGSSLCSAACMPASVLVRQINVWPTAVAWLAAAAAWPLVRRLVPWSERDSERTGPAPAVIIGLGALAAFATLAVFIGIWGGLVPPRFQPGGEGAAIHGGGGNTATAPFTIALFGVYALPALVFLLPDWWKARGAVPMVAGGGILGLALGLLLESVPGFSLGRTGGWLWTLAQKLPSPGGRSLLLIGGSTLGGLMAGMFLTLAIRAGRARAGWLLVGFAASFLCAYSANAQVFQRYFDPPVLLAIGWSLALVAPSATESDRPRASARWTLATLGITGMQVVFVAATVYARLGRDTP